MVEIVRADPAEPAAAALIDALSAHLLRVTGRDGRVNFRPAEVRAPEGVFLLARMNGEAVGCGGLRRQDIGTAEIKRLFVQVRRRGVGTALLTALIAEARGLGYRRVVVETDAQNLGAVAFYTHRGFTRTENYGPYAGCEGSVCFELLL